MASIGKFVFGLASGEASLSLANINFDFAVVKMEPPKELLGLGNSLSKKRKFEAEEGSIHATARRLGALFAEVLPNTPNLARVYGIRASEIASNPEFNPVGKDSDGALASHIGADGTSIWAAATSSKGALQAHLLACMLARVWSRTEAISIWSELVSVRKRTLRHELQASEFNINAVTACQIEIRRDELAEWDASARSWLITADKAKTLQQTQLMLIIDNIGLKMPSRPEVYEDVMSVWTKAMSTVDSLVSGVAQSVQSPEVFLGLSAWHLYPDMSFLGAQTTYIDQKDDVIVKGGHITIGLHSTHAQDENGISWSMPLACLRYYGKPVISEGSLSSKSMRVPFRRLVQIAIGGAISGWNENAFNIDDVCTFFELLSVRIDPREGSSTGLPKTWMAMFGREARNCLQETKAHRKESFRYISLGRRRYGSLLSEKHPPPLLGLEDLVTFLGLLDVEKQIAAIREISITDRLTKNMKGVNLNGAIIRYFPMNSSSAEYASLMPQSIPQTSRKLHRRWVVKVISPDYKSLESLPVLRSLKIMHSTGEPCGFLRKNDIKIEQTDADDDSFRFLDWKSGYPSIDLNYLHERSDPDDTGLPMDKRILGWSIGATSHHYGNMKYRFSFGSSNVQVFVPVNEWKDLSFKLDLKFIAQAMQSELIDGSAAYKYLANTYPDRFKNQVFLCDWAHDYLMSLNALYLASLIYHGIPNADINLSVLSMKLHEAKWAMSGNDNFDWSSVVISRARSLACIAMFESGSLNIGVEDFEEVIAISSGNSLYVSEYLLCDPFTAPPESKLRCLVGNIGKPGLAMLLSARDPDVREPDLETWEMINHNSFDGRSEDNFESTSLQLHLTGYEMPLNIQSHGVRDIEAFYVEAVVSVYDQGVWVADINVLSLYQARTVGELGLVTYFTNILLPPRCPHVRADGDNFSRFDPITSVDCWSEFLDLPKNLAVIRARRNWVARLALATVMAEKEKGMMVAGETVCWTCVEVMMLSKGLNASEIRILC